MSQFKQSTAGILIGVLPVVFTTLIGMFIYQAYPHNSSIGVAALLIISGCAAGIRIYEKFREKIEEVQ